MIDPSLQLKLYNIAFVVKEYRVKVLALKSDEFANVCGISRRTVSKIETAKNFNIVSLIKVIEKSGLKEHHLGQNLSKTFLL